MSFEDVIINCVDCGKQLPFAYQFDNQIRCPACKKKFIALSREDRIAANKKVARRFNQEGK